MIIKLGEVASFVNGYAFKPSDWSDNGMPIIRIQDLTGNSYKMNRYNGDIEQKYKVQDGDVLISWSASLGVYVWHGENAVLNQHIFKVVFDKTDVSKDYFVYQIEYRLGNAASEAHGATMKHLTKSVFNALPFYLPKKEEQEKIAKVLNKITELTNKTRKQAKLLDDIIKFRFIEMFGDMKLNKRGWKLKSFEELTYLITDGEHATPKRTDKGIYLLSARNILNHSLQLKDVDYINEKEYDRIAKRIIPQEGDILISCSGTVGRCCSVPSGFHFQMVRSVALIRFKEYINPIFAEYMITSDYLQEQINSSKTVSSQANLFQGKIRTLKGFVPPIEMQNEFSVFVHKIDKSKHFHEMEVAA